jgi:hypothetical protein
LGEAAHFVGDDGKSCAGLARTGGLNGGIEGENVGLKGDLVDGLDDLAMLALDAWISCMAPSIVFISVIP